MEILNIIKRLSAGFFALIILVGLYGASLYNYLLFHSIAEGFSIVIACGIFMVAWNTRHHNTNHYILFVGVAYLFIGILDSVHTISYKGMNILPGYDSNVPTQLWIAARYMESLTLLAAPLLLRAKIRAEFYILGYTAAVVFLLVSIFYWRIFPDAYLESAEGLTPFKIASEYIICLIFLVSGILMVRNRQHFDYKVLKWLLVSIVLTIISEFAFTKYAGVYGFSNMFGHYLKIASFYFIYKAVIETGLAKPYDLLFRDLNQHREWLNVTLKSIGDAVIATNTKGQITFLNKVAESLIGWSTAEADGKPIQEVYRIVNESTRDTVENPVHKALQNGMIVGLANHTVLIRKDGNEVPIDDSAAPILDKDRQILGAVLVFRDISERRNVEQTLKRNERRLSLAISATADAIWEWNFKTQETYYSPRWYEMLGYEKNEIPMNYEGWKNLCHPEDFEPAMELIRSRLQSADNQAYAAEFRMRKKDGAWLWILGRGRVVERNAAGKPVILSGTNTDITERKRAQEQLELLNESLEQQVAERTMLAKARAKQLQSLAVELIEAEERERRRMAQILHDDLQQVLAAAKMQLATCSSLSADPALENVGRMLQEALHKTRGLSHELSPPVLHHSGLVAAATWLIRQMKDKFGLQVQLETDVTEPFKNMYIEVFLFRAMQELLFNVVKHADVKSAGLLISANGHTISIRISDQGKGFDPEILNSNAVAAGLGLLSLRERAQYIGGRLEIKSTPEQGSCFTLTAPLGIGPMDAAKQPQVDCTLQAPTKLPESAGRNSIRVMFANGHKVMRQGLIQIISGQPGIEIIGEATNGRQVLERARHLKPDVIIMDISMPEMDGIEATRRIKAELPDVRVIGLSMHEDEQITRIFLEAGADSFVSKTASSAELLKMIYAIAGKMQYEIPQNSGPRGYADS